MKGKSESILVLFGLWGTNWIYEAYLLRITNLPTGLAFLPLNFSFSVITQIVTLEINCHLVV